MSTDLTKWPFSDPPETLALTHRTGIEKNLMCFNIVRHVDLPGETPWQFLFVGGKPSTKGRMQLPLSEIVKFDPSVKEVADLPIGWRAYRVKRMGEWRREELNPPGWPFKDPRDAEAFTSKEVLSKRVEAVKVTREAESEWYFYPPEGYIKEDWTLESLEAIYRVDSSVAVLGDLPVGWQATRRTRSDPWVRSPLGVKSSSISSSAVADVGGHWPFSYPRETKVTTFEEVLTHERGADIAIHQEDGSWHFGVAATSERPFGSVRLRHTTLEHILSVDPTFESVVTRLPVGGFAHRTEWLNNWTWREPSSPGSKQTGKPSPRIAGDADLQFRSLLVTSSAIAGCLLAYLALHIRFVAENAHSLAGKWAALSSLFGITAVAARRGYIEAGGHGASVKRGLGWGAGTFLGVLFGMAILGYYFPRFSFTVVWALNGAWLAYFLAVPLRRAQQAGNTRTVQVLAAGAAAFVLILFLLDLLAANTHS